MWGAPGSRSCLVGDALHDVLLNSYAAKMCARRVHNDFDRTISQDRREPDPELQRILDEGVNFEADVLSTLTAELGEQFVSVGPYDSKERMIRETVHAMHDGVAVISDGWLPDDTIGGRKGRPDLLLKVESDDGHCYVPGDIKAHKTLNAAKTRHALVATPPSLTDRFPLPGWSEIISERLGDYLQLAHYSRMLDAAGFGPKGNSRSGFIIGRDTVPDDIEAPFLLVWHDLNEPKFSTYSASQGKKKRSALERYDHEHAFRVKVAGVASQRTGHTSDPEPMVDPIGQDECLECPYQQHCANLMHGMASHDITSGRLSIREWLTLQSLGVTTTSELAQVDTVDSGWISQYLEQIPHQRQAETRLKNAVTRARMIEADIQLMRTTDKPLIAPTADIEIDFDIEWDSDDQVYLWGARARTSQDESTAEYKPFVSWRQLDDGGKALAADFVRWLREQIEVARATGKSLKVFHYTTPETRFLVNLLDDVDLQDLVDEYFVDLAVWVRSNVFGVQGLGLKKVANALGFQWASEDDGGLQSQTWLVAARDERDPDHESMRERILEYNANDVRATAWVRDHIQCASPPIS